MRLPIGIQDFPTLIENNYVYVDKTRLMKQFMNPGQSVFLSRPRRFGKSLLLSTVQSAYEGRKDLFKGLWLEQNHNFKVHPIIRLDFSLLDFEARSLEVSILEELRRTARKYGFELQQDTAKSAFEELVRTLATQAKVVVLIDEYDKPITDNLLNPEKRLEHQSTLKRVYGTLKPLNPYLEFVMLTGVSKIGKLSLFSDLNNLVDISLNPEFASICGYSREEIEQYFMPEMQAVAEYQNTNLETLWEHTKHWYNGYSWDVVHRLYCPFSFLLFLQQKQFKSYWYETGTPTFLLNLIEAQQLNPLEIEAQHLDANPLVATNVEQLDPIGLMFQTGYLTITDIQQSVLGTEYNLAYPNFEVRMAFSRNLLGHYSKQYESYISSFVFELRKSLLKLDWNAFFAKINQIFASIPYEIFPREEAYPHSLLHLMLVSTGLNTRSQVQTSLGRMDILLEAPTHKIIFEIKTKGSAQDALDQINTTRYADGLEPPVVKVGVFFDLERKEFSEWVIG